MTFQLAVLEPGYIDVVTQGETPADQLSLHSELNTVIAALQMISCNLIYTCDHTKLVKNLLNYEYFHLIGEETDIPELSCKKQKLISQSGLILKAAILLQANT